MNEGCHQLSLKLYNRRYIYHLQLADDQVIIVEGTEDMHMLPKLKNTCNECELNINVRKNEHLTTSLNVDDVLENISLAQLMKYLGTDFQLNEYCHREEEKEIGQGKK